MRIDYPRIVAAFVFVAAVSAASSTYAQDVHILPHPDHPDPHSIYLESARLQIGIDGGAALTTVVQEFVNPNPWRAEGIYLFPLPEGAAVTDFRLTMDGKPVKGEVLNREEARRIYLDIVRRIKDPALMEWVGHRVFQARIFPFEPRDKRTLTLSYAQVLPKEGDYRSYRWNDGRGRSDRNTVITGPQRVGEPGRGPLAVITPAQEGRHSPMLVVSGTIRPSSRAVGAVHSPTHALAVREEDEVVHFSAEGSLEGRRGFSLYFSEAAGEDVGLDMLMHRPTDEDGYFLLSITPGRLREARSMPRDVIFVLDTSGSMSSDRKIQQAVEALTFGLGTLGRQDRFGLVTYSSGVAAWEEGLSSASAGNVERARTFARGLSAAGGTNIEGALEEAARMIRSSGSDAQDRPAYVVFLTDGLPTVGEEDPRQLLEHAKGGFPERVRLFSWGVGYDVNTFLLDHLAGQHGGRAAYVEPGEDLEAKVGGFFQQVSAPVLSDLVLQIEGVRAYDIYPQRLPDLFGGSEITLLGRYRGDGRSEVRLTGNAGGRQQSSRRVISMPRRYDRAEFLGSLWAQRKVGYLLEQIRLNGESEELKAEVIALGEKYGIMTPYTAYLVTEEMRSRVDEAPADAVVVDRDAAQRVMYRSAQQTARARSTSVYAGAAGAASQTGAQAVQSAKAERIMQESMEVSSDDLLTVQRVANKTFRLDEKSGIWQDAERKVSQQVTEMEVGSDAYMRLLDKHPELARYTAVGTQVEVVLDGQAYRIRLQKP